MIRYSISTILLLTLVGLGSSTVLAQDTVSPVAENPSLTPAADAAKTAFNIKAVIKSQTLHAPENLTVGQPLQLEVIVEHSPDTLVSIPHGFKNTRWDLLDTNQSDVAAESAITTTISLNFAIFRPGQAHLPAFAIRVLAPDGTTKELLTDKVAVLVRSNIDATLTPPFAPPRDPVPIWKTDYTLAWIGGFALGGVFLTALVVFAMRRRKIVLDDKPVRSAHDVAMEKLRSLEHSPLLAQGETMIYYVRMSEAVREYLGRRFDFPGTELTTAEINAELTRLQSRWPRGIALEDVRRWLEHCDFVKFSGSAPSNDAARSSLERAFGIIELTRRRSEIGPQNDAQTPVEDVQPVQSEPVEETIDADISQELPTDDIPEIEAEK